MRCTLLASPQGFYFNPNTVKPQFSGNTFCKFGWSQISALKRLQRSCQYDLSFRPHILLIDNYICNNIHSLRSFLNPEVPPLYLAFVARSSSRNHAPPQIDTQNTFLIFTHSKSTMFLIFNQPKPPFWFSPNRTPRCHNNFSFKIINSTIIIWPSIPMSPDVVA